MPTELRPFHLPLLVEKRKREEEQNDDDHHHHDHHDHDQDRDRDNQDNNCCNYNEHAHTCYTVDSSSDATSPVTPTFSARGHLRCSSSTSSFDLTTPVTSESPSSPPRAVPQPPGKRVLPDVEEEPFECVDLDDAEDDTSDHFDLYDCLRDEPGFPHGPELVKSTSDFDDQSRDVDYDIGFLSDNDSPFGSRQPRKRRGGSDPRFFGVRQRFGSRFASLSRIRSTKTRGTAIDSPVSEFGCDRQPTVSRAPSSRSSSHSGTGRYLIDRFDEPPLPPTPAESFYESSDSIGLPGPIDTAKANLVRTSIERERALATTPLLPPLLADPNPPSNHSTAQASPLESPTVASAIPSEPQSPSIRSPALSSKPSKSSFRRLATSGELPPIPAPDAWSDRLGHANFTILPQPYKPQAVDMEYLQQLRADWATARANYTKHLVRTGEHYGTTSKTYALTEAKWTETDRTWRCMHDELAEAIIANGASAAHVRAGEAFLTAVPRMGTEGKFPERGDEDIVGPMARDNVMAASLDGSERKNPGFWRNLAGRVGLKK